MTGRLVHDEMETSSNEGIAPYYEEFPRICLGEGGGVAGAEKKLKTSLSIQDC